MKSKISFFNKTIFLKNATLYWPIWVIYTLALFINQPILLWIFNNMEYWSVGSGGYKDEAQFRDLMDLLGFMPCVIIIAIGAVFTGMALFSYMYNHKSANMIHSLPVDRTQLYGTTLISGWAFLIVPLFATAVFTTILCIVYTIPGIAYVWAWFLVTAITAFVAFSIVTICALFTGHIVVMPMYIVVVNCLSWIIYWLIYIVVTTFGYGVSSLGDIANKIAKLFCPLQCFYENLGWEYAYTQLGEIKDIVFHGTGTIVFYLIVAVALYVAAYVIYRKRKIEQAGDFLTVNWVKPIFRSAVGIIGAIYGAMLIREVLLETRIGCSVPMFVVIMLVIGAICYFAADMFIKKSFHVFKKKDWLRCGIFSVVLFVFYFGLYAVAEKYENYLPKEAEIESATVQFGYAVTFDDERVGEITEIHETILRELDAIEKLSEDGDRYYNSVRISYQLTNGEYITRRYMLPTGLETLKRVVDKISELEADEENFLRYLLCDRYDEVILFESGWLEAPFINGDERLDADGVPNINYESKIVDVMQAKALYEAIVADAKAGTLIKYNTNLYAYEEYGYDMETYFKSGEAYLNIKFKDPEDVEDKAELTNKTDSMNTGSVSYEVVYEEYDGWMNANISFGPDCENIVNTLIDCRLIESVEDIWWGEAEELLK
ncbi:MAG: ABC transporter permease [Agathobacter sp.]|nr:ABC transporter permease [Agathobacter sp.]